MQNPPQQSVTPKIPVVPIAVLSNPVGIIQQSAKTQFASPTVFSPPQAIPKKRIKPSNSKTKDTDTSKKRKVESGAAKERSGSILNAQLLPNNNPNVGTIIVAQNTPKREDSLDDVDVNEGDLERVITLPQSLPSDEEDDEEEEDEDEEDKDNAGVSHNEGVLFEKESGKSSQQEAEDEEEMKMVEQWDREDREKQAIEYGEKMKILLSKFTKEQLERYEYYRRSAFPKAVMKRLIKQIAGTPISSETSIVISGITKIFVGELVETAREVMREWRESGPIRPVHLREAYRRLKEKDPLLSSSKYNKKLFRR